MFICLLKAHPRVLTHTPSTTKRNISFHRRYMRTLACLCVCVWMSAGEGRRGGVGGVHHCIKWSWAQGPFCHRQGLICQWRAVRSWGKAGTKVLKGCVTMRVLRGEPSRVGPRQHGTSCANHSAITFLCNPEALCGHSARGTRTQTATEGPILTALCFLHSADPKFAA